MSRRDLTIAGAIFAGAAALRLALLGSPVHDYDEGVYWQSLLSMQDGYALYRDVFDSQPPVFLDATFAFFIVLGKSLFAARAAAVVGSLITVASGTWIAYRLSGRTAALAALLFLTFDGVDLAQSVTLQAESLAFGFATLSVALLMERYPSGVRSRLAIAPIAGVLAAAAALTKLSALACVAPFVILMLWKRDLRLAVGYVCGALAFSIAAIGPHAASLHQMIDQVVAFHLSSQTLAGNRYAVIATGFQVPLLLLSLAAVAIAVKRRDVLTLSIGAWFACNIILLFKVTPLFPHHLDAVQAPMAILAAYTIGQIIAAGRSAVAGAAFAVTIGVQLWQLTAAVHDVWFPRRPPSLSQSDISNVVPPNSWVITDLQATAASAGLKTPPALVDTSLVRIRSGYLTGDELITQANDPRVKAVIFGGRRLSLPQLRGFTVWVQTHFHRTASRFIWVR